MATPTQKSLKNKADKLFSLYVRERDGYRCRRCYRGKFDGYLMHCAHIFSRRHTSTRCDPDNAVCLCAGCHMELTHEPDTHVTFFTDLLGADAYDALRVEAFRSDVKASKGFWQERIDTLTELRTQLETQP